MGAKKKPTRKSMSVKEMASMLGLGKTESYYLIHKGYFETVEFYGGTRVMIDSFEKWYNKQNRYHKVSGPKPSGIYSRTMSVKELASLLGLSENGAAYLVGRKLFKSKVCNGFIRVDTKSFEKWYASQFRYWKVDGSAPGTDYPPSISPSDIAYMLGLPLRNTVYCLLERTPEIKTFSVDRMTRVDLESFEKWYASQSRYKKIHKEDEYGINSETEE